mmetsp:Transcript_46679/g.89154  ORF Transcript_46679/g.89154 Transcript_46679/m.89154 type:complete len:225 (+) Transcript_46679:1683-2357(+)
MIESQCAQLLANRHPAVGGQGVDGEVLVVRVHQTTKQTHAGFAPFGPPRERPQHGLNLSGSDKHRAREQLQQAQLPVVLQLRRARPGPHVLKLLLAHRPHGAVDAARRHEPHHRLALEGDLGRPVHDPDFELLPVDGGVRPRLLSVHLGQLHQVEQHLMIQRMTQVKLVRSLRVTTVDDSARPHGIAHFHEAATLQLHLSHDALHNNLEKPLAPVLANRVVAHV